MLKKKFFTKEDIISKDKEIQKNIIIIGDVGIGKSQIAKEICKGDIILIDCSKFYNFQQLINELKNQDCILDNTEQLNERKKRYYIIDNIEQFNFKDNLNFFIKELNCRIKLDHKIIIFTTSEFFKKLYKKIDIYNFAEIPCAFDEAIKDILNKTKVDADIFWVRKIINNNLHYLIGANYHMDYFNENIFNKITDCRKNDFIKIFYLELLSSFIEFKYDIKNLSKCKIHCIEEYFKNGCFLHQQFIDTFVNSQKNKFLNVDKKYNYCFNDITDLNMSIILDELKTNNQLIIYSYEFCNKFIEFLKQKNNQKDISEIKENIDRYFLNYYIEKIQYFNDFNCCDIDFINSIIDKYTDIYIKYLLARLEILEDNINKYIHKLTYFEQMKEIDKYFYGLKEEVIISFCENFFVEDFINIILQHKHHEIEENIDIKNIKKHITKAFQILKQQNNLPNVENIKIIFNYLDTK